MKKLAPENFAILGHRKRAAEIEERAAENFSVLKSAPAKACFKKCTAGSKVPSPIIALPFHSLTESVVVLNFAQIVGFVKVVQVSTYGFVKIDTWISLKVVIWICQS